MHRKTGLKAAALGLLAAQPTMAVAQTAPVGRVAATGPLDGTRFRTTYIQLGSDAEGLLYEPREPSSRRRTALVFSHPNANGFTAPMGAELAARGYAVLLVNYRGGPFAPEALPEAYLPSISRGLRYVRTLPGVSRAILGGHSGGGELALFYANIAQNGAVACQGPEKIVPCRGDGLNDLEKPDGLIVLDSPLGAFHRMSGIDPALGPGGRRDARVDMFASANGYDPVAKSARYSDAFARRYYAAQSARFGAIVRNAEERARQLSSGGGELTDDAPLLVRGVGVTSLGARLYGPDVRFAARTRSAHLLLRGDGSEATTIIVSVRASDAGPGAVGSRKLYGLNLNTTVRHFLASNAIRTRPDFAITADNIVGVDWASAVRSPPANAAGVTVPTLVMTMSCHYLVMPGEIIFESVAAKDKSYAAVEGATHMFTPCRPGYGDTVKRTFDHVDRWLSARD